MMEKIYYFIGCAGFILLSTVIKTYSDDLKFTEPAHPKLNVKYLEIKNKNTSYSLSEKQGSTQNGKQSELKLIR